jgi:hypothetical protein
MTQQGKAPWKMRRGIPLRNGLYRRGPTQPPIFAGNGHQKKTREQKWNQKQEFRKNRKIGT